MKRDWDTIRRILLAIEQLPGEDSQLSSDQIPGLLPDEAAYHMRLLREAGLIEGGCRQATGPAWCYARALTWNGHELLDSIRADTAWQRIKTAAREKGVDMSLEAVMAIARSLLAQAFP